MDFLSVPFTRSTHKRIKIQITGKDTLIKKAISPEGEMACPIVGQGGRFILPSNV